MGNKAWWHWADCIATISFLTLRYSGNKNWARLLGHQSIKQLILKGQCNYSQHLGWKFRRAMYLECSRSISFQSLLEDLAPPTEASVGIVFKVNFCTISEIYVQLVNNIQPWPGPSFLISASYGQNVWLVTTAACCSVPPPCSHSTGLSAFLQFSSSHMQLQRQQ